MKGIDLIIRILIPTALALFVIAGVLNKADSLSGLHLTLYDFLLLACLQSIVLALWSAASNVKDKRKELTKLFGMSYKLEHALRLTAFLFSGVIILGVNNEPTYILHLIFTALAIISGYVIVLLYPDTKLGRVWSYIGVGFGAVTFGLGFFGNYYSVTWAEFFVAIPIAIILYFIIKVK